MAIQIRRGTDAEWESNKSNIVAGEPAVAMDTERMFIGTGSGTFMEVANIELLADAFDSSASYVVGDFVSYHGKVYKCNTDHSGAWNASHFDEVTLADALDASGDDVYTKAETDTLLALKADKDEFDDLATATLIEPSTSGAIASFDDGANLPVSELLVGIEAVQDLHGYDHPWASGGGKNICPPLVWKGSIDNTSGEYSVGTSTTMAATAELIPVDFANNTTYVLSYDGGSLPTESKNMIFAYNANKEFLGRMAGSNTYPRTFTKNSFTTATTSATGDPAYIRVKMYLSSGAFTEAEIANGKFQVEVGDTASTFEPYTNICPISGRTGATLWRMGKNLVSPLVYNGGSYNPSIGATLNFTVAGDAKQFTANQDKTVFTVNTTANNQTFTILYPIKHGYPVYNNIALSGESQLRTSRLHLDKNFKVLSRVNNISKTQSVLGVMTPSENDAYYAIVITNSTATSETITMTSPMACFGNTDAPYEPYVGDTYPITWQTEAGTVYGGTVDYVTGVLTVTHKIVKVSSLTWSYASSYGSFRAYNNDWDGRTPLGGQVYGQAYCSHYEITNATSTSQMEAAKYKINIGGQISTYRLLVNDPSFNGDASAFKSAMGDCEIVYELVTPQTYQLTPTEVLTLLGENNIFANCGSILNVTYKADTKLYIDNAISGVDELLGSGVIE